MAVCNAANEIAVAAFLDGQIGFLDIATVIEASLSGLPLIEPQSLAEVEEVDRQARAFADQYVKKHQHSISYQSAASPGASAGVVKV